ncbi:hypothetical protein BCON_0602g00050 [Botryotinia convoluta]|uniref:Uncharacterized protein n=1 Tax=Botryotinia convoluta TaxID=54673 RepID=A0A4Z1H698_9HELO|nr:hypothetical protein BCON_0602g00050 [Botryotinia convoluta]
MKDDGDDWLKDSALMANVCGSSGLNIADTGAQNGNDGLFFERDLNLVRTVDLMIQVEDKENCFRVNGSKRYDLRLAWVCVDGSMYRRACWPLPLRGPSSSWASRNGCIKYDKNRSASIMVLMTGEIIIFSRKKLGDRKHFHESSPNVQWRPPLLSPQIAGVHGFEEGLTRVGGYIRPQPMVEFARL